LGGRPQFPSVEFTFFIRVDIKGVKIKKGDGKKAVFAVKGWPIKSGRQVEAIFVIRAVQIAAAPGVLRVGPILNRPIMQTVTHIG
jgi:hypothetical protein